MRRHIAGRRREIADRVDSAHADRVAAGRIDLALAVVVERRQGIVNAPRPAGDGCCLPAQPGKFRRAVQQDLHVGHAAAWFAAGRGIGHRAGQRDQPASLAVTGRPHDRSRVGGERHIGRLAVDDHFDVIDRAHVADHIGGPHRQRVLTVGQPADRPGIAPGLRAVGGFPPAVVRFDIADVRGRVGCDAGHDQRPGIRYVLVMERAIAHVAADGRRVGIHGERSGHHLGDVAGVGGRLAQGEECLFDGRRPGCRGEGAQHDGLIQRTYLAIEFGHLVRAELGPPDADLVQRAVEIPVVLVAVAE